jgi:hypothetical protein
MPKNSQKSDQPARKTVVEKPVKKTAEQPAAKKVTAEAIAEEKRPTEVEATKSTIADSSHSLEGLRIGLCVGILSHVTVPICGYLLYV